MKLHYHFFIVIAIMISPSLSFSQTQVLTEREIVLELEKRGLKKEEVSQELLKEGIDITSLENVTPEEIKIIQNVILDMEKRGGQQSNDDTEELTSEELEALELDTMIASELGKDYKEKEEEEKEVQLPEAEVYGQEIFRNDIIKLYEKDNEIAASGKYILDSDDEISISIWGKSQFDKKFKISSDGYITLLNDSKRVFLKGLSLDQAKVKLGKILAQYYRFSQGEYDVSLSQSRIVTINIVGEVFYPGPITIPAINNAFNALSASKGPTNLGTVRNIQLIKNNGERSKLDIYKYLTDPQYSENIELSQNDIIIIPVSENIVTIEGAVKRPMKYEMLDAETIQDLIKYSGGLDKNALLKTIRIKRFDGDKQIVSSLNYNDLDRQGRQFKLFDGDHIIIDTISSVATNFVEVIGEVSNPGIFERKENYRVGDILSLAGLKTESRTDIAFVKRKNSDGSFEFEEINIDRIISNPNSEDNLTLRNEDIITIWAKNRFVDEQTISIDGAVRYPDKFAYDVSSKIKLREAVILAGGLRRDASDYVTVYRKDPLNPKVLEYLTITDLDEIFNNSASTENITLSPFDSIYVHSDNTFIEESVVSIYGAVNNPGPFQYGQGMTIEDLIVLAGGFKLSAATNNVEVSRVIIKDNQPTNVVIAKLEVDKNDFSVKGFENGYELAPFDRVAIRYVPEFELQESVILKGEVKSPGAYAIVGENEKISSIILRAGGLTEEAFTEGASLQRAEDDLGAIVVKLNDIFENEDSRFDFIVRGGDTITIPKRREFVTIKGATNVWEVLSSESINKGNEIHVPYHRKKNALFYLNHYAGGFNKNANKRSLVVKHPNGEVKKIKGFGIINKYPEVKEGSIISVSFKTSEDQTKESEEKVNWTKVLGDSVGQAMSILTLLLLIQQLD